MTSNNKPTNEDKKIGARIRLRREAMRIRRAEFAAAASITVAQISKYELGQVRVPADRIYLFADMLKVDPTYFFADFESVDEFDRLHAFMLSREGIELNAAFNQIADQDRRASIADLIETLAS